MKSFLRNRRKTILQVSLAFIFGALATGIFGTALTLVQTSRTISSAGSVIGIGVGIYWNQACTDAVSSINWGTIEPGASVYRTIYIRNEGNTAATLSMTTSNWNPTEASSYITLNWGYTGQTLSANQVLRIALTLSVSPDISGITNFSFDITITAAG